jgi:Mrp family chromosome partitioning ATPase
MFDALRRAESERRRRQSGESPQAAVPMSRPVAREHAATPPAPREHTVTPPAPRNAPRDAANVTHADVASSEGSFPGEMLRELGILRNALESRLEKKTGRVLMFTSAMHEEGVTSLAVAYTRLLAMHGDQRIVLIELNARTPALAARLGLPGREGVTHYFTAQRPFASLAQRPVHERFDVVHVGEPDATLIQINLERGFPRLLEDALRAYDTVVIDAPPVVVCPETPPLAPFVDGTILVVHCGRTKRETVDRSIKQIQQFQGQVLGVVLNRKRYYIPDFIYRRL